MNKKLIIGLIVVLALLLGAYYFRNQQSYVQPTDNQSMEGEMAPSTSLGLRVAGNAVNMLEQKLGDTASVNLVVLEDAGYVVIHEMVDGKPGPIIGHSNLLDAGQSNRVPVVLTTNLVEGKHYTAMLHLDDGDGSFDPSTDAPATFEGNIVMMDFDATPEGSTDEGEPLI